MKQKLYDLKNQRKGLLDEAKAILMKDGKTEEYTAKMADVEKLNANIEAVEGMIAEEAKGMEPGEAYEKSKGTYGRFNEAVKYIDPRKE